MNSFGEYLRDRRERLGLPLRTVASEIDIDISFFSKIERNERMAAKNMLPRLAKTLEVKEIEIEVEFIKEFILADIGDLRFLKTGLEETITILKNNKYEFNK